MEHHFYADAMTNYLVLRCPPEAEEGYQYRMLAVNRIQGLLPCSFRTIDGEHFLYYGITSCQSIARIYDHRIIGGSELKRILYSIAGMIRVLSEYLLDAGKMLLDPEYIFFDPEKEQYCFTYYPETGRQTGSSLFEYFSNRLDGDDRITMAVVYRLCELAEAPDFVLRESILDHEYLQAGGEGIVSEASKGREEGRHSLPAKEIQAAEEYEDLPDDIEETEEDSDRRETGRWKKAEEKKQKKERPSAGGLLGAAVFFLLVAAGLWFSGCWMTFTQEELLLVRSGILGSLVLAIAAAAAGMVRLWRKEKQDQQKEQMEQEEKRKNAMVKTEDFC